MRRIVLPALAASLVVGAVEVAQAERIRLDLTDSRSDWLRVPPRRELSGWAPEDPRSYPGILVEVGRFGLIGENGQIDGRIRFGGDATLRISAKPSRLVLRFKQRF